MSVLKDAKHELFAQYRSEGKTADESYMLAGYAPDRSHASRLATNGNIFARVRELMDRRAKMVDVTIVSMTERYNEAIDKADARGSDAAVMAGLNTITKMHGLIIDKVKVEQGRLDEMSDDAIAEDIERRLANLAARRAEGIGETDSGTGPQAGPEPDNELHPVSEAT